MSRAVEYLIVHVLLTACNDCWDEAFRRSQFGPGCQADYYEALLLLPPSERPWCAFARGMTQQETD